MATGGAGANGVMPMAPGPAGLDEAHAQVGGTEAHQDIARDIGQQVETMILQAKRQSEAKVGHEIEKIKNHLAAMNEKIDTIRQRVNSLDPVADPLPKGDLQRSIVKLEEVWEGEIGTLKHELWQTIQAHNHNADLMKHHKDAIDQLQSQVTDSSPVPDMEQYRQQLVQVEKVMQREQAKQTQIDQLMQRLSVVQQQLNVGVWGGGGVPYPGMGAMPSAVMGAMAPAAPAGKKAPRKGTKNPKAPKASAINAAMLRAEAPEFVPTTAGWGE